MPHRPCTQALTAGAVPRRYRQRGIALVVVLGMLAVLAVLATHAAVLSQITAAEAKVAVNRGRLFYAAESAADRAFWLLLWDRRRYPNRGLGADLSMRENDSVEPWLMDGRTHSWDGPIGAVAVTITDANRGLDVSGTAPESALKSRLPASDEHDRQQELTEFLDLLGDYADVDNNRRLYGREEDDYEGPGGASLPRNGPLQFREELFWLDGLPAVLAAARGTDVAADAPPVRLDEDDFRIVPPSGSSFPGGRLSSFPPSAEELQRYFPEAKDQERLQEGISRWLNTGEPLDQAVPADLLTRLQEHFSFQESGVAVITVTARSGNDAVRRTLRVTRDCRTLRNGNTPQPTLVYWEHVAP
ncbi:MAG: hypothetical protein WC708_16775 [Lentisphaeria bacterium]